MRILRLVLAIALAGATSAIAADEPWQSLLRAQLKLDQKCDVTEIGDTIKSEVEGGTALFVRVRCLDTREFDASRLPGDMRFKLVECSTVVC